MTVKTSPTNPFIYGPPVSPEKFIGREREVDIILDRLANPYNRGGSTVTGESGIGKTSLLHYLRSGETQKRWPGLGRNVARFVYIQTHFISPFTEVGFWEFLFGELEEWLGPKSVPEKIIKSIEMRTPPSRFDISSFFTKLGTNENKFVVVLLDGFDFLMKNVSSENKETWIGYLHNLRALLNLPAPRGFSLIVTSGRDFYDLFENVQWLGSDFTNNMVNLPLGPFNETQIDDLIDIYLANTGINFDEIERNHLKEVSLGHPKKLQREAHNLFEKKKRHLKTKITQGDKKMDPALIRIITGASALLVEIVRDVFKARQTKRQKEGTEIKATVSSDNLPIDQPDALQAILQQIDLASKQAKIDTIESLVTQLTQHKRNWNDYSEEEGKPTASAVARVEAKQSREDEELLIKNKTLKLKQQLEELTGRTIELSGME